MTMQIHDITLYDNLKQLLAHDTSYLNENTNIWITLYDILKQYIIHDTSDLHENTNIWNNIIWHFNNIT